VRTGSGIGVPPPRPVLREVRPSGVSPGHGERIGDMRTEAGVHLIGSLSLERGVGQARVVLLDVERDEPADASRRVELVQEEPAVLENSPPGLNACPPLTCGTNLCRRRSGTSISAASRSASLNRLKSVYTSSVNRMSECLASRFAMSRETPAILR